MNSIAVPNVLTEFGLYRKVSARLPEFLATYPPQEGFGIEIDVRDPLSCRPGLQSLYLECIRSNRTNRSLPASDDPSWKAIVFTAYLTKDGQRLHSASTLQHIQFDKDYESAETRARGRLLSALGFGPEALDYDETNSSTSQRSDISPAETNDEADPDSAFADNDEDVMPAEPSLPTTATDDSPSVVSDIKPQLQGQVDVRCSQLDATGTSYTRPVTQQDALAFLRETRPQPVST